MLVEENDKIYVIEDNRVVASMSKTSYYGKCPNPQCEEEDYVYDVKKNANCPSCGTSLAIEFPSDSKKKKDSEEKETSSDDKQTSSKESSTVVSAEEAEMSEAQVECDRCGENKNCTKQAGEWVCGECKGKTAAVKEAEAPYDWAAEGVCAGCQQAGKELNPEGLCIDCAGAQRAEQYAADPNFGSKGYHHELLKGARVSHREQEGTIVSIVPGLYGDTYGVKFDDGKVAEFLGEQLSPVEGKEKVALSSVEEIVSDFSEYEVLSGNTLDEIAQKERIARSLNLRAKTLILDKKLSMHDRIQLDKIATSTTADIVDFKDSTNHLLQAEEHAYLARAPKYKLGEEFMGWGSVARTKTDEDISWVDGMDVTFDAIDDTRLASMANDSVAGVEVDKLADGSFMQEVKTYAKMKLPTESHERFAKFFDAAVEMRLQEPVEKISKEASAVDYDSVDDSALFM